MPPRRISAPPAAVNLEMQAAHGRGSTGCRTLAPATGEQSRILVYTCAGVLNWSCLLGCHPASRVFTPPPGLWGFTVLRANPKGCLPWVLLPAPPKAYMNSGEGLHICIGACAAATLEQVLRMRDGHRPLAKKKISAARLAAACPHAPVGRRWPQARRAGAGLHPRAQLPQRPKLLSGNPTKLAPSVHQGRMPMRAWCPKQGNPPHCARTSAIPLTDTVHNRRTALSLGCSAEHAGKDRQHGLPTC